MSTVVCTENPTKNDAAAPAVKVRRSAFYLESRGQPIFAWLHWSEQAQHFKHGIIICPPLGYEQIHAHRSLRHLADACARAGLAVLRLDYHGTGDSAGSDEDADRHATWLANIRDARLWLQQQLGIRQVSLFGLRLGACLAIQAAAENAVANLLLWAPVLKGRAYAREMRALSLTAEYQAPPLPESPDDIEAAGFVLSKQTVESLNRIDLLKTQPQCLNALIVARADMPEDRRLLEHLSALGIQAEQIAQPGYADMMAEPHDTKVPRETIAHTVDWLLSKMAGEYQSDLEISTPTSTHALIPQQQTTQCCAPVPGQIRERIVHISRQPDLFGIMSEPARGPTGEKPLIVLINGGSAYRVGPSRLNVFLARQLAAQGFQCLRMDLCGLGDSIMTDVDAENNPYAATAFRDVDLTLKYLQAHWGAQRVVLMGLCSGAYVAFQAAAQLANPVLVESVLINPLTFFWKEGMTIESSPAQQIGKLHYYWNAALQPGKWLKLFTGQSRLGLIGAFKMLVARWQLGNQPAPPGALNTSIARTDGAAAHPRMEDVPADLERAAAAGRRLTCFFSEADPGYRILMFHAKRKVTRLRQAKKLLTYFIADADHTFSARVPRRAVVQAISAHLCQQYGSRGLLT